MKNHLVTSLSSHSSFQPIVAMIFLFWISTLSANNSNDIQEDHEPSIFLDYTQTELDKAYDQTMWESNANEIIKQYAKDSAAVRAKYPPKIISYGTSQAQRLDIFSLPTAKKAPIFVFIHGGSWKSWSREDFSAPAPTFIEHGKIYIAVGFDQIPDVRLPEMVSQCQKALIWIWKNAASFGGDPDNIYVAGHSSGGHLCAMMLTTDWNALGLPKNLLKGGMILSGMFDLYPVSLSSRNAFLTLSPDEIISLSPIRHLNHLTCPVIISQAEFDSPEFKRQSENFSRVLAGMGKLNQHFILPKTHHFEEVLQLNSSNTVLGDAALKLTEIQ